MYAGCTLIYAGVRSCKQDICSCAWDVHSLRRYVVECSRHVHGLFFYRGNECGHRRHCRRIYSLVHPPVDAFFQWDDKSRIWIIAKFAIMWGQVLLLGLVHFTKICHLTSSISIFKLCLSWEFNHRNPHSMTHISWTTDNKIYIF